jgi:hypothetical protein
MLDEEKIGFTSFSFKVFEFFIIIDKSLIDPGDMSNGRIVGILESISDTFDGGTFVSFFL